MLRKLLCVAFVTFALFSFHQSAADAAEQTTEAAAASTEAATDAAEQANEADADSTEDYAAVSDAEVDSLLDELNLDHFLAHVN